MPCYDPSIEEDREEANKQLKMKTEMLCLLSKCYMYGFMKIYHPTVDEAFKKYAEIHYRQDEERDNA